MDVVGKTQDQLVIGIVVLHGDFRRGVVVRRGAGKVNDVLMNRLFFLVDELHKTGNTALITVVILQTVFRIALITQFDMHTRI